MRKAEKKVGLKKKKHFIKQLAADVLSLMN